MIRLETESHLYQNTNKMTLGPRLIFIDLLALVEICVGSYLIHFVLIHPSTEKPSWFEGQINEDAYTVACLIGVVCLCIIQILTSFGVLGSYRDLDSEETEVEVRVSGPGLAKMRKWSWCLMLFVLVQAALVLLSFYFLYGPETTAASAFDVCVILIKIILVTEVSCRCCVGGKEVKEVPK